MLRLVSISLLALWLFNPSKMQTAKMANLPAWLEQATWVEALQPQPELNAAVEAILQTYLVDLENRGLDLAEQGIWIQAGNKILGQSQGSLPLPAASLTKIATTLAALSTWEPTHTFTTTIGTTGTIANGVLQGDLVVQGSGDPFLVWEEAIAIGNALNQAGIHTVTGDLIVTGDFAMNYERDRRVAGAFFREALNADLWSYEAENQYLTLPEGTPRPRLVIAGLVQLRSPDSSEVIQPVLEHHSLPLYQILKAMNVYSNNVMAEMLAEMLGGANTVSQKAAQAANVPPEEILLANGSGLGVENQISAKAVVAMLMAIQYRLQTQQINVADLFPVMGRDEGTLIDRQMPLGTPVKTGTLADVSALAGVLPTRDRGLVWFAVINRGWNLDRLRSQQDILLQALVEEWQAVDPVPTAIQPNDYDKLVSNQLGAADRNKILLGTAASSNSSSPAQSQSPLDPH